MHEIDLKKFPQKITYPTILYDSGKFLIKIAETDEEIQKTLRLRYEVFNIEQGMGLETAAVSGVDFDKYDEYCLQLIVMNKETDEFVGTYRIHLGDIAAASPHGFYSASEYDIEGLDKVAHLTMEVGRTCILPEYRTGSAMSLLWGGISELMMRAKLRYLLGCVSLETYNPAATWALYDYFKSNSLLSDVISGVPKDGYELEKPDAKEIEKYLGEMRKTFKTYVPPLFKGYLRLGTKVGGEPLYDHEFKSVDFLIFLDTHALPERYSRHYNMRKFVNYEKKY